MPLTPENIAHILIEAYKKEPKPSRESCEKLAKKSGLQVKQVIGWFKSRCYRGPQKQVGFSETQRSGLLQSWQQYGSNPTNQKIDELANNLGLTTKQVKRWFQDRRRKGRVSYFASTKTAADREVLNHSMSDQSIACQSVATTTTSTVNVISSQFNEKFPSHLPSLSVENREIRSKTQMTSENKQFDTLETKMNQRFNTLETEMCKRFDTLETKMDESITSQQTRLDEIAHVVSYLRQQFELMQLTLNPTNLH